jgi:hypothetical protein
VRELRVKEKFFSNKFSFYATTLSVGKSIILVPLSRFAMSVIDYERAGESERERETMFVLMPKEK